MIKKILENLSAISGLFGIILGLDYLLNPLINNNNYFLYANHGFGILFISIFVFLSNFLTNKKIKIQFIIFCVIALIFIAYDYTNEVTDLFPVLILSLLIISTLYDFFEKRKKIDQTKCTSNQPSINKADKIFTLLMFLFVFFYTVVTPCIAVWCFMIGGSMPPFATVDDKYIGIMNSKVNALDLLILIDVNKINSPNSWKESIQSGYKKYNDYGDIIAFSSDEQSLFPEYIGRIFEKNRNFTSNNTKSFSIFLLGENYDTSITLDQKEQAIKNKSLMSVKPGFVIGKVFYAIPFLGLIFSSMMAYYFSLGLLYFLLNYCKYIIVNKENT